MSLIKAVWGFVAGNWQPLLIAIAAGIIVVAIEEARIGSIKIERDQLAAARAADASAVKQAEGALATAVADNAKQAAILSARDEANQRQAADLKQRYQEIMETKNADDGPVAPVLQHTLDRLRHPH